MSSTSLPNPLSKIRLEPCLDSKNLSSLKRLNALLLPVSYPEKFYREIAAHPLTDGALTRIAFWDGGLGAVGAIRARYEPPSPPPPQSKPPLTTPSAQTLQAAGGGEESERPRPGGKVYIMTLCTLSPFRNLGVAGELLRHVVERARELGAREVYAHVWTENGDALEWYRRRGFESGETVGGYYRKLRPDGAVVVRLRV